MLLFVFDTKNRRPDAVPAAVLTYSFFVKWKESI